MTDSAFVALTVCALLILLILADCLVRAVNWAWNRWVEGGRPRGRSWPR